MVVWLYKRHTHYFTFRTQPPSQFHPECGLIPEIGFEFFPSNSYQEWGYRMCLITICKIFRCWHLEAVFAVERCELAISYGLRYCNRECMPPLLRGKFSLLACSLCSLTSPISSPYDARFVDFLRLNGPLMRLLDQKDVDDVAHHGWVEHIRRARDQTKALQAKGLAPCFTPSGLHWPWDRAAFENHPVDMEVLGMLPCDGSCPLPHPEAFHPSPLTSPLWSGGQTIGPPREYVRYHPPPGSPSSQHPPLSCPSPSAESQDVDRPYRLASALSTPRPSPTGRSLHGRAAGAHGCG